MLSHTPMNDCPPLFYVLLTVLVILVLRSERRRRASDTDPIPAVGALGIWQYYTGGIRYLRDAPAIVEEGCIRYPGRVFRVPRLFRWDYVVSGKILGDLLASAPDSSLSQFEGGQDTLQMDLTIGPHVSRSTDHVDIVRSTLTRNLARCFPDLHDEVACACDEVLGLDAAEWKPIVVLPTTMNITARSVNRIFVGLPACRDPKYIKLVIQYTVDVVIRAQLINMLPALLRPILGPLISSRNSSIRKGAKILGPLIQHRMEQEEKLGRAWAEQPNDFISWLLDSAEGFDRTMPILISRILVTNMAAIHTTSTVLSHALFDLVANPSYIDALRQEAITVIQQFGWTKAALGRMHKIDSFLRETQRMHDNGPVTMVRKVMDLAGFKFSDGAVVPFGAIVQVASRPEHFNPDTYDNPTQFDGFRFSKMRQDREGERGTNPGDVRIFDKYMVTTSSEHLSFGHKHHACPGRFFAATELKSIIAHLLIHYDLRAEKEGVRPADNVFGVAVVPNRKGRIIVRRRAGL